MFLVAVFMLVLIALITAGYYLKWLDNYLNDRVISVYRVIVERIAIGTWFSQDDLYAYACRSPYIRWCLKRMWQHGLLYVRTRDERIKLNKLEVVTAKRSFSNEFVANHEFLFLPSNGGMQKQPAPEPLEFIDDQVLVGA